MRSPLSLHPVLAYMLTLLIAFAAARMFVWWHVPLPWLTGPLLVTGLLSVMQLPVVSLLKMRNLAQWAMGSTLGMYFSPHRWIARATVVGGGTSRGLIAGPWHSQCTVHHLEQP